MTPLLQCQSCISATKIINVYSTYKPNKWFSFTLNSSNPCLSYLLGLDIDPTPLVIWLIGAGHDLISLSRQPVDSLQLKTCKFKEQKGIFLFVWWLIVSPGRWLIDHCAVQSVVRCYFIWQARRRKPPRSDESSHYCVQINIICIISNHKSVTFLKPHEIIALNTSVQVWYNTEISHVYERLSDIDSLSNESCTIWSAKMRFNWNIHDQFSSMLLFRPGVKTVCYLMQYFWRSCWALSIRTKCTWKKLQGVLSVVSCASSDTEASGDESLK